MKLWIITTFFLSTYLFFLVATPNTSLTTSITTYSTPVPMSWFVETVRIEQQALPPGIDIYITSASLEQSRPTWITITNTTSIPLYILTRLDSTNAPTAPVDIPISNDITPSLKLLNNQTFDWSIDNEHPTGFWRVRSDLPFTIYIWQNRIGTLTADIGDLEPSNPYVQIRPTNVSSPPPQAIVLDLVYGTQFLKLPLTIEYTTNGAYDPCIVGQPDTRTSCTSAAQTTSSQNTSVPQTTSPQKNVVSKEIMLVVSILVLSVGILFGGALKRRS